VLIVKILIFQDLSWLIVVPENEMDLSFSFGRGRLVYVNPNTLDDPIELTFPYNRSALVFNPQENLFPVMNLLNFYALSEMLSVQYSQKLTWPKRVCNIFTINVLN
jgi:hypothetical protein